MRIAIFGMGAVGGNMAARLAEGGAHEVSAVCRGAMLEAVRANGLKVRSGERVLEARIAVSDDPADLGPQDLVISTAKATHPDAQAQGLAPLLGADTPVILAQNGIPWWYATGLAPERPAPPDLTFLDPDGALHRTLAPERILGAVINSANEVVEPGVVLNVSPQRNILSIGAADDRQDDGVAAIRALLEAAGIASPVVRDIRQAIWRKLMGNMSASILCLLTGRKLTVLRDDPQLLTLLRRITREGVAIAQAHGIDTEGFDQTGKAFNPPDHMPSIGQDFARGRPLEIDVLLQAPQAFARKAGIDTPSFDAIAALARRKAIDAGLYAG